MVLILANRQARLHFGLAEKNHTEQIAIQAQIQCIKLRQFGDCQLKYKIAKIWSVLELQQVALNYCESIALHTMGIMVQTLGALATMQSQHIVKQDLKPVRGR